MRVRAWTCEFDGISITWDDGAKCGYPAIWLYDNNPAYRDSRTGQRLIDVADLPAEPRIRNGQLMERAVRLMWADDNVSEYALDWLFQHGSQLAMNRTPGIQEIRK